MYQTLNEINTRRLTNSSNTIQRTNSDNGLSTLWFLLIILVVVTLHNAEGADDSFPWVKNSWRRRYNESSESLYVSYSGNPWGQSSSIIYQNDQANSSLQKKLTKTAIISGVNLHLRRSKRGVVHLYNMVLCATGCNPLAYKGYGCYCGFLGSGFTIDGIDRCCKMHDWCYEATDCPMFLEYFVPYYWKCYRGYKPICAIQHGDLGGSGSCAQRLCECDRALAECLKRYPCPTTKAMCTSSPWRLVQNLFMLL